ncbi:hypothetical protein [Psychrobacter sp. FDAARGOS_221]|uniref:hypothetical protein n=1 Tax=Psychrobacter sp. FDAARGOS_221 TaxID=1975705 RepID=UPI000BB551CB|nr:hypothetical protein [Psychrobacter sp. FDAARGOS_221]PNK60804.1 hypothetical protein A6J60_007890 [Psychrobacter sp. FDAARGOS_221]
MASKKFLLVFTPYLLIYIGYILYELTVANNADVKGWWPLALLVTALFHGIVSRVYCAIDRRQPSSYGYTALYGVLFTLPFIGLLLMNKLWQPIDWYAVNTGQAELTMTQAVVNSIFYLPIMAALILLSHFIIRQVVRAKADR